MSIQVAQDFKYQEDDWWKWWVWIEGPDVELDKIDYVEYKLHRSFPNPVRTIDDRDSKFQLKTSGWGVFPIRIKVVKKNGEIIRLEHQLVLKYPDGTATTA